MATGVNRAKRRSRARRSRQAVRDRSFSRIQAMPPNGDVYQPAGIHVRNVANLVDALSLQPSVDFLLYLDFAALKYRHFHCSAILAETPLIRQQQTHGALKRGKARRVQLRRDE